MIFLNFLLAVSAFYAISAYISYTQTKSVSPNKGKYYYGHVHVRSGALFSYLKPDVMYVYRRREYTNTYEVFIDDKFVIVPFNLGDLVFMDSCDFIYLDKVGDE